MMRCLLFPLLFTASWLVAEEGAPSPAEASAPAPQSPQEAQVISPAPVQPEAFDSLVDSLDQGALQEAFRLLTKESIQGPELDPLEINRAALQGLLERLEFGAMLLTEKGRAERDSPFRLHHERVHDAVAYVRFGRYTEEEIAEFDAALETYQADEKVEFLILDLRSPQAQAEFSIAARLLSRFRPPNELLFKIRRPGNERPTLFVSAPESVSCRLKPLLLVDQETGNVGEIIAAVLQRKTDCLVLGEATPGLAVEYRDIRLAEDCILRYAVAEVALDDDSSIFRSGITPDLITPTPAQAKHALFRAVDEGKALVDFLYQKQRPRMNEAALVAGTDPEIDYYLLRSQNQPTPWDQAPPQDRALQQAVDLLHTTRFLQSQAKGKK